MSTHYVELDKKYEVDSDEGNELVQEIMFKNNIESVPIYVSPRLWDSILEYGDPDGYKTNTKLFCYRLYEKGEK